MSTAQTAAQEQGTQRSAWIGLAALMLPVLTVAVTQLRQGRLAGRRCSTRAQKGRSCRVRVTLVRLHFRGHRGHNSFKLLMRKLAAGHYTALIYATDGRTHRSRTAQIAFTIVPSRTIIRSPRQST